MKITVALTNKAFLLWRATAVAVAAIAIPGVWVASRVSSRLAVDLGPFIIHHTLDQILKKKENKNCSAFNNFTMNEKYSLKEMLPRV